MSLASELLQALSSRDGQRWFGTEQVFPWPDQPDPSVVKLVLGDLDRERAIALDEAVLAGLADIKSHYPALTHLHLWGITNLERIGGLPEGLKELDIRHCSALQHIGEVRPGLSRLDLAGCTELQALPAGNLSSLQDCWLEDCRSLTQFAPLQPALNNLATLVLHGCGCDLDSALMGNAGENVIADVRQYFQAGHFQGWDTLAECKIVVLGNGGVGKTELVRALKGLPYDEHQKSTEGIHLWKWNDAFEPFPEQGVTQVKLNIWDFGGQDLYHNTHRLFLESRAVFVVVWRQPNLDGTPFRAEYPDDPVRPLNYWLDQIFSANPNARPLIVRTHKANDASNPPEGWRQTVREEYRDLPDFALDSAKREEGDFAPLREALFQAVRQELGSAQRVQHARGRIAVREKLAAWQPGSDGQAVYSPHPLIRSDEFQRLCVAEYAALSLSLSAQELAEQSHALLRYLHNSGVVYSPPSWQRQWGDNAAGIPVVVDQRWVIDNIYSIFKPNGPNANLVGRKHGRIREQRMIDEWRNAVDEDGRRLDAHDCWVMTRVMESTGLLVIQNGQCVLPEFLPDWEDLLDSGSHRETLAKLSGDVRVMIFRDRELGQGIGSLLVGAVVKKFGLEAPLFKYGAIVSVAVGDRFAGDEQQVTVKVEWRKEHQDDYQGDIVLSIFGEPVADDEVVDFFRELIVGLPGFPANAQFLARDVQGRESPLDTSLRYPQPFAAGQPFVRHLVKPILRLTSIGISLAGSADPRSLSSLLPEALYRLLDNEPDRAYEIVYYKAPDRDPMVRQLYDRLIATDLMIAFVDDKYLHSKYCMTEFYEAARFHQANNTFVDTTHWPKRLWAFVLPDARALLHKADHPDVDCARIENWKLNWFQQGRDYCQQVEQQYGGEYSADQQAPEKHPYHSWLRYAKTGRVPLERVIAALADRNREDWQNAVVPEELPDAELAAWAENLIRPVAEKAKQALSDIASSLSEETREERIHKVCLDHWQSGEPKRAAEFFEIWLDEQAYTTRAREQAESGQLAVSEDLRPLLEYWRQHRKAVL